MLMSAGPSMNECQGIACVIEFGNIGFWRSTSSLVVTAVKDSFGGAQFSFGRATKMSSLIACPIAREPSPAARINRKLYSKCRYEMIWPVALPSINRRPLNADGQGG